MIWSWSPMPCEKHGPRNSVTTNPRPSASVLVFHTAWETMMKSYIIVQAPVYSGQATVWSPDSRQTRSIWWMLCIGSLRHQVINSRDIDCVKWYCYCFPCRWVSRTSTVSASKTQSYVYSCLLKLPAYKELTDWDLVTHICVGGVGHYWFRQWLVVCLVPCYHLNPGRLIVNSVTARNTFLRNANQNSSIFTQKNALENVVYKLATILFGLHVLKCTKALLSLSQYPLIFKLARRLILLSKITSGLNSLIWMLVINIEYRPFRPECLITTFIQKCISHRRVL